MPNHRRVRKLDDIDWGKYGYTGPPQKVREYLCAPNEQLPAQPASSVRIVIDLIVNPDGKLTVKYGAPLDENPVAGPAPQVNSVAGFQSPVLLVHSEAGVGTSSESVSDVVLQYAFSVCKGANIRCDIVTPGGDPSPPPRP